MLVVLSSRGIDSGLTNQEIAKIVIGLVLATALWAALGVGLGALVRNQVGAIVGALGWALLVENLLTIIPTVGDWVHKYGLNGVTNALSNIESDTTGDVLSQAAGGALLLALHRGVRDRRHAGDAPARRHELSGHGPGWIRTTARRIMSPLL